MTEFYFPPPLKAGEFNPDLAEQTILTSGRNVYLPMDQIDLKINALGTAVLAATPDSVRLDYDLDRDNDFSEPGVRKWHFDTHTQKLLKPVAFVVGATIRNPDIVTGVMKAPCLPNDYGEESSLAGYLLKDDGQAAVASAIDRGNLEPVEEFKVGDLLLMLNMTLHRRASTPPEEWNLRKRLVLRSFIRR